MMMSACMSLSLIHILEFREEDLEKVFPSPVEIEILKIEEVSNHYE